MDEQTNTALNGITETLCHVVDRLEIIEKTYGGYDPDKYKELNESLDRLTEIRMIARPARINPMPEEIKETIETEPASEVSQPAPNE